MQNFGYILVAISKIKYFQVKKSSKNQVNFFLRFGGPSKTLVFQFSFFNLDDFLTAFRKDFLKKPPVFITNVKSPIFFPEWGGDKALILTYLVEVFLHYYLFISISAIFRRNRVLTLGPCLFYKNLNHSKNFQCFCLLEYYLNFSNIRYFGSKNLPKGSFRGC